MGPGGLVFTISFGNYNKCFCQFFKKLGGCIAIQIFHHTIVVKNRQLTGRKVYGQKIIIFFISFMTLIVFLPFFTHMCRSSCAMVAIGDVGKRYILLKNRFYSLDHAFFRNNPYLVMNGIVGFEIIFRFIRNNLIYQSVYFFMIGIGKKNGLRIKICDTDMVFTILFFFNAR